MKEVIGQGVGAGLGIGVDMARTEWQNANQIRQQRKLNAMSIENSKEMAQYNAELQKNLALEMWDKTSPEQQVRRLKEAGLNVGLMYGGVGGGGGATASSSSGNIDSGKTEPISGMGLQLGLDAATKAAQIELIKAQKDNVDADTENKKGADRENTIADTELKKMSAIVAKYLGKEAEDFYNEVKKPSRGIEAKTYADELEARQAAANVIYDLWENGKLNQMKEGEVEQVLLGNAKTEEEIKSIKQGLENMKAELKGKELDNILTEIETSWASGTGFKSGDAKDIMLKLIGYMMKQQKNKK